MPSFQSVPSPHAKTLHGAEKEPATPRVAAARVRGVAAEAPFLPSERILVLHQELLVLDPADAQLPARAVAPRENLRGNTRFRCTHTSKSTRNTNR